MADSSEPLIGAHDLTTPSWAQGFESVAGAALGAVARAAPRTMATAVRWAWRASPRMTVLSGVVQLLSGCATAFGLFATADVFTRLLAAGPTPERVLAALPALATVVAALAARGLLDAAVAMVQGRLAPLVEQAAQDDLHAALLDVELVAFDDPDFTELVERASIQGLTRVRTVVGETGDLLASLVSVAAAVVTAGVLHPLLAPVVLLAALPQGWASVRSARLMFASFLRMSSARRRLGIAGALITGRDQAAEVRALTTRGPLLAEHRRIADQITADAVRVARDRTLVELVGRTLAGIGSAGAYAVLALLIYFELLELAVAGAAALAMRMAAQAVSNAVYGVNMLYESGFYVELFRSCLSEAARRRRRPGSAPLTGPPTRIELTGVSFRYPGQDEPAVEGIDLTLRRGEVVALVGENGSGKSTLAKLITGLYLPEHGTVRWDGVDVGAVDADALLTHVAVVLQDPVNWPMSARNNVRVGRLERADPDGALLLDAANGSGTDTVVAELPDGWSTVLSKEFQGGRDLSGGQWQRVAVARGLFRDAPLVVADEPTAALDARAEHAVFGTLRGRTGAGSDRITVLITHRLANVRSADRIVVLEHGRITEQGRHDELMALGGTYHELFSLQARAYAADRDTH
ncbi:ABC transporter ATP-binding protein [Pseudonocardia humida]|uniref:ABC transporter ATP-binding protein n=1 Tax=Pseudonocardia humida TaxID=2800819 RepID=A0ABT1A0W3_9PSEU|nr:ATP-binding cassette domain-containing protein [Pseudonocardia humida]MCO1656634.1 ABC transporter ATP-binding protein [Pseudonocardia humida]